MDFERFDKLARTDRVVLLTALELLWQNGRAMIQPEEASKLTASFCRTTVTKPPVNSWIAASSCKRRVRRWRNSTLFRSSDRPISTATAGNIAAPAICSMRTRKECSVHCPCTASEPQRIVDALTEGKLVVAIMSKGHFTSSGHFMVLRGVQDGKIMVADPASYKRSGKLWDLSIILNEASKGAAAGGPFWIIGRP